MPQQPSPDVAPVAVMPQPPPPPAPATARQMHEAARAQREVLGNQLERLEERRRELSQPLQDPMVSGADRTGLEKRISDIDARITDVEKQIAQSDAMVAQTAAVPGAVIEEPPRANADDEEEAVAATLAITIPLWLIVIWLLRRRWRRAAGAPRSPADLATQLTRVEQSVESIAIEVERIGEAQRFTARVLAEGLEARALGAGAAEAVAVRQREAVPERKR